MADALVAMVYGQALYDVAKESEKTARIRGELLQVAEIIWQEPTLAVFLTSPAISAGEKKALVEEVFGGEFCVEMLHFLYLLIDKGRAGQLRRIARRYVKLQDEDEGVAAGKIYSAIPLSAEQIAGFAVQMQKLLQKRVQLRNAVDPALIGGVRIQVDGQMIDQSLAAGLAELLREMQKSDIRGEGEG